MSNENYNDYSHFNDDHYDYKVKVKGKYFFIKLNFTNNRLYSWESAAAHLSEGAGGSVSFQDFQESDSWQNFIRRTYGVEILEELIRKIKRG